MHEAQASGATESTPSFMDRRRPEAPATPARTRPQLSGRMGLSCRSISADLGRTRACRHRPGANAVDALRGPVRRRAVEIK